MVNIIKKFLIFFLLSPLLAFAISQKDLNTSEDIKENETSKSKTWKEIIDRGEQKISDKILSTAETLDRWLGGDSDKNWTNKSRLKFFYSIRKAEGKDLDNEFGYKIHLSLPRVQNHFKLLIEQKSTNISTDEHLSEAEKQIQEEDGESEFSAALRYFIVYEKWEFKLDTGLRVTIPFKTFTRAHIARTADFGKLRMRFSQEFYLDLVDGVGESTRLNFSYPISKDFGLTIGNYSSWVDSTDLFSHGHYISLLHSISKRRYIKYQFGISGNPQDEYIDLYYFHVYFRQLIHKKWLYLSLSPIVQMSKDDNFKAIPSISFRVETVFGQN